MNESGKRKGVGDMADNAKLLAFSQPIGNDQARGGIGVIYALGGRTVMPSAATGGRKLYQQIADTVFARITDGFYAPGQRLPSERELADEFGVSRPTIREAMIALEVVGTVQSRHGSGIFVSQSVPSEATATTELDIGPFELTEARRLFEGEAAALAAAEITDEEIAELNGLLTEMQTENERDVKGEHADRAFHVAIAKATRNSAIVGVVEHLWDIRYKSPLCIHILARARRSGDRPRIDEHRRIVEALQARDPVASRLAMRDHLHQVIEGVLAATETEAMEQFHNETALRRQAIAKRVSV
jgi:GntR family transcriptional regulator, hexuronate regulon transcriptional repressor